jgi:zona occludens toxin (predicted ATPase)
MIRAHVGTPGGGKTYSAVVSILENLKRGRQVYTNIDGIDDEKHREMIRHLIEGSDTGVENLHHLSAEQAACFWVHCDPGSLIVIDEVHKLWSSRSYSSDSNKAFADWCSTHRHYGYDVILITQSLDKIDGHVRSLIEWTYRYKKIGFMGGLVNRSYMEFAYSEDDERNPLSKKRRSYQGPIFQCYKSFAAKDIKEGKLGKAPNIFKHPIFFAIPVVFGLAVYMLFFRSSIGTGDYFGVSKAQAAAKSAVDNRGKVAVGGPSGVSVDKAGGGYWINGKWVGDEKGAGTLSSSASLPAVVPAEQNSARVSNPGSVMLSHAEQFRSEKGLSGSGSPGVGGVVVPVSESVIDQGGNMGEGWITGKLRAEIPGASVMLVKERGGRLSGYVIEYE